MFVILAVGADTHGRRAAGSEPRGSRGKVGFTRVREQKAARRLYCPRTGAINGVERFRRSKTTALLTERDVRAVFTV